MILNLKRREYEVVNILVVTFDFFGCEFKY